MIEFIIWKTWKELLENKMKIEKETLFGILIIPTLILVLWIVRSHNIIYNAVFEPAEEAVRRKTFEQNKSYIDGMAQELRSMQLDHIKANDEQKKAIERIVLHRTAALDLNTMPQDVQSFVLSIRAKSIGGSY